MPFFSLVSLLDFTLLRRASSKAPPAAPNDEEGGNSSTLLVPTTDVDGMTKVELKNTPPNLEPEPINDSPRDWTLWSVRTSLADNGIRPWVLEVSSNPHIYTRPLLLRTTTITTSSSAVQHGPGEGEVLSASTDEEASEPGQLAQRAFTAATDPEFAAWFVERLRAGDSVVAGGLLMAAAELTYNFMTDRCAGYVFREILWLYNADGIALLTGAACCDPAMLGDIACHQYGSSSVKALVEAAVLVSPNSAEALSDVAYALGDQLSKMLADGGGYGLDVVNYCLLFPEIREFLASRDDNDTPLPWFYYY